MQLTDSSMYHQENSQHLDDDDDDTTYSHISNTINLLGSTTTTNDHQQQLVSNNVTVRSINNIINLNLINNPNANSNMNCQSIQLINSNNCRLETITINNHTNDENAFKIDQNNSNTYLSQHQNSADNTILMTSSNSSNGLSTDELILNGKADLKFKLLIMTLLIKILNFFKIP